MTPPLSSADLEAPARARDRALTTEMAWLPTAPSSISSPTCDEVPERAPSGPTVTAQDRATAAANASPAGSVEAHAQASKTRWRRTSAGVWREHRVLAVVLRAGVLLAPAVFASAATLMLGRVLPPPPTLVWAIARLLLILAVSGLTMAGVRQATRRLLPLTALLRLSLAFPDETPKRLRLALRAPSAKHLEERLNTISRAGLQGEPADVAAEIVTLIAAISAHHKHTRGHSERVRAYAELLGAELGLNSSERQRLRWAALLHDIGKIAVPTEILDKPGKPTAEEWAILAAHPAASARLAEPLKPWMGEWWYGIGQHHEKWNGTGYPDKLTGTDISLSGRIVALADSFETMTAARSYKKPMSITDARAELVRCAGSHFDPAVVRAFLNIGNRRLRMAAGLSPWLPLPLVNALLPLGQFATAASQTSVAVFAGAAAVTAITPDAVTHDALVSVPEIAQLNRQLFSDSRDRFAVALDTATSTTIVTVAGDAPASDADGSDQATAASTPPTGRNASAGAAGSAGAAATAPPAALPAALPTGGGPGDSVPGTADASPVAAPATTTGTTTPAATAPPSAATPTTVATKPTTAPTTPATPTTARPATPTTVRPVTTTVRTTVAPTTVATTAAPKPPIAQGANIVANADQFTVAAEVIVIVHPLDNDTGMNPASVQIMKKFPNVLSWINPDHTMSILARKASIGSTPVIDYRICVADWSVCRTTTVTLTITT